MSDYHGIGYIILVLLHIVLFCSDVDGFIVSKGLARCPPSLSKKEYHPPEFYKERHLDIHVASQKPFRLVKSFQTNVHNREVEGEEPQNEKKQKMTKSDTLPDYDIMKFIHQKEFELRNLLQAHEDSDDVLQRRLNYASSTSSYKVARALKRVANPTEDTKMAVITEIKRKTPNGSAEPRSIASFSEIGAVAEQLANLNVDALMIGVDDVWYGGNHEDIRVIKEHFRTQVTSFISDDESIPPIIARDIIIHPIQMALAIERGADAVVLMASVLGPSLEEHVNIVTMMGEEAIIECHTPNEIEYALNLGATIIMVTNWDRLTNTLHPDQASAVKHMIPAHIVSIASGGVTNHIQAAKLADEGYDAICVGEGLVHSTDIGNFVEHIRNRRGLPGQLRGWGVSAEDVEF